MPKFDLGKQVGGLPLGVWVAIVGASLGVGWYFSRGAASKTSSDKVPVTESGVGEGGATADFTYEPSTGATQTSGAPTTNEEWGRLAKNWLIGSKGADPGVATTAIDKFLTGADRNLQEQTLINLALIQFGSPPESVPIPDSPIPQIPKPTAPPKTTPAKPQAWTYYTVRKGDKPSTILRKYPQVKSWWNVYWTNDKLNLRPDGTPGVLSTPYALTPGIVLLIPTTASGLISTIPSTRPGNIRYYVIQRGDTLAGIAKKYHIHEWNLYIANDVVGMRADGSRGFLNSPSVAAFTGRKLIVPYQ